MILWSSEHIGNSGTFVFGILKMLWKKLNLKNKVRSKNTNNLLFLSSYQQPFPFCIKRKNFFNFPDDKKKYKTWIWYQWKKIARRKKKGKPISLFHFFFFQVQVQISPRSIAHRELLTTSKCLNLTEEPTQSVTVPRANTN